MECNVKLTNLKLYFFNTTPSFFKMMSPRATTTTKIGPPKIIRFSTSWAMTEHESMIALVEARSKMDVRSSDYESATKEIAATIADLRSKGMLCDCSDECTDLRGFAASPKALFKV